MAQITSSPVFAIPATPGASISLLITGILLIVFFALLHRKSSAFVKLSAIIVIAGGIALQNPELRAQLALEFTDPKGETLIIPVQAKLADDELGGFEPVDFSNKSNVPLSIDSIVLPVFDECFPSGRSGPYVASDAGPPKYASCAEGLLMPQGYTCRVDLEQACVEAELNRQAFLSVHPQAITIEAFGEVAEFTLSNMADSRVSAENLVIAVPAGLTLGDDCGDMLAPGDSCTLSVVANGAGGPAAITISADNAYKVSAELLATEWDPEVPVTLKQSNDLQRLLDSGEGCNPFGALPFNREVFALLPDNITDTIPATSASYSEKGFEIRTCGNFTLLVQQLLGQPVRTLLLIEGDIQPTYGGVLAQFDQSTLTDTIVYQVAPGFEADSLMPADLPTVLGNAVTRSYGGSLRLKGGQHITGRVTLRGAVEQVVSAMNYPTSNVVLTTGRQLPPLAWQSAADASAGQDDGNSFTDGLKPTLYVELAHEGNWVDSAGIQGLTLIDTTVYYDEDNNFGFWGVGNFNSNPVAMFYNGPLKFSKDPSDYLGAQVGFGARDITLAQYLAFMAAYQGRYPYLAAGAVGAGSATDTYYDGILASLDFLPLDLYAITNSKIDTLNFKSGDSFPDLDYFNLVTLGPLATFRDGTNGPLLKIKGDGEFFGRTFGTADFTVSASGASGTGSGNSGITLPTVAGIPLGALGTSVGLSISAAPATQSMTLSAALQAGPLSGMPVGLTFSASRASFSIPASCTIPTVLSAVAPLNPPLNTLTPASLSWTPSASLPTLDPSALLACAEDIFVLIEGGVVYVFQAGEQLMEFASSLLPQNQVTQIGLEGIKFSGGALVNAPGEILNTASNIPGATDLANAASAVQDEINRIAAEAAAAAAAAAAKAAINASINFVSGTVLAGAGAAFSAIGDLIGSIGNAFSSFFGSSGGPAGFSFQGPGFKVGSTNNNISAKDISIGHRTIWIVERSTGRPYKYRGDGTFRFDRTDRGLPSGVALERIDADAQRGAVGIASDGTIWVADASSFWRKANGYAVDVGVGGGYIWIVSSERARSGYKVYRAPFAVGSTNFSWDYMGTSAIKIDVGGDGCAWAINNQYQVYEYAISNPFNLSSSRGWQNRDFTAIDVAVSQTNRAWFTGFDYSSGAGGGRLWTYNIPDSVTGMPAGRPVWEVLSGRADNIAAGDGNAVWISNSSGNIFAGTGRLGQNKAQNGGYFPCQ